MRHADRDPDRPSVDLMRRATDALVLTQLMAEGRLTRSQLAARTGISKPTISECIRRLAVAGRVVECGRQDDGGRGRSGTYYRLSGDVGVALALHAGPEGVIASVLDCNGNELHRSQRDLDIPVAPRRLASAIGSVLAEARAAAGSAPFLAVALSVADPFDQRSGRIRNLPHSPFLIGELRPQAVFDRHSIASDAVHIDNDTNFAAFAEHRVGAGAGIDHFAYLWLGAGVGLGIMLDGTLHRGWTGLAGEIWQTLTRGPGNEAMTLVECFVRLGLCHPRTTAIDVDAIRDVMASRSPHDRARADAVVDAVAGALANATALVNPQMVIIAGPWADASGLRQRLAARLVAAAVPVALAEPAVTGNPFLAGARLDALERARARLLTE